MRVTRVQWVLSASVTVTASRSPAGVCQATAATVVTKVLRQSNVLHINYVGENPPTRANRPHPLQAFRPNGIS